MNRSMTRISATAILVCAAILCGCENMGNLLGPKELSIETIAAGLKEALTKGTERGANRLSKDGGYYNNDLLRIPVPPELDSVAGAMRKIGLSKMVDSFEKKMNEGAEKAASKVKPLFWKAIRQMTFQDAKAILFGKDTEATEYFRRTIGEDLRGVCKPVIASTLGEVGAVRSYNSLMDKYMSLPFVKKPLFSLEDYVTDAAMEGLFHVVGEEEKEIRENPVARTTALLQKVFGAPRPQS
jgi:hypothetical protein